MEITKVSNFKDLENGSCYTITGAGGDLNDWVTGYTELLQKDNIGTPVQWFTFTGKQMNDNYGLTGKNKYPNNLQFLSFPLTGLKVGKLAMFKIKMQDRWFDDIVDNNARRELK